MTLPLRKDSSDRKVSTSSCGSDRQRRGGKASRAILLALAFFFADASAQTAPALSVDTAVRRASRNFYNGVYPASEDVASGWNGNVAAGVAGTTSQEFQTAVTLRINFFRALAGISNTVTLSPARSTKAQKAALMMSANRNLSHAPPTSWLFYTADGAEAAGKSNLALGFSGPGAMSGYVEDSGGGNAAVGHRRWLLHPPTLQMGTGDIPSGGNEAANALWVFDTDVARAYPRLRDGFVAWPPKGYVPHALVFPRWSFSLQNANFGAATVVATRNGVALSTAIESRAGGYGDNALVWSFAGAGDGTGSLPPPANDTTYQITISNVMVGAVARSFTYAVVVFDPAKTASDDVIPVLPAPTAVGLGQAVNFPFPALPEATGYEAWSATALPVTWTEGAESAPLRLQARTTGTYSFQNGTSKAAGARSFQLCQPGRETQALVLNAAFLANAGSALSFQSRFGYMTPLQTAAVEVSVNDGGTWSRVFARVGNDAPERQFTQKVIGLGAFANRIVRIRFLLETTGSYYPDTGDASGWLIDEIRPVNLSEATAIVEVPLASNRVALVAPSSPTVLALAVRPVLFQQFPLEYGPVSLISVGGATLPPPPPGEPPPGEDPPPVSPTLYSVLARAQPASKGTVVGGALVEKGRRVRLVARPKRGRMFLRWTENGRVVSRSRVYVMPVDRPRVLVAHFR